MKINVKQASGIPAQKGVDGSNALIVMLPGTKEQPVWPDFPYRDVLKQRFGRCDKSARQPFVTDLPNANGTRVAASWTTADTSAFELLGLARKTVAPLLCHDPTAIDIICVGMDPDVAARCVEALVAASLAAIARMPSYKSEQEKTKRLKTINVYGVPGKLELARTFAEAHGNGLARQLTAMPPNELTPAKYRKMIASLAKRHGWRMTFLNIAALKRKKAGAFLAVAQGSPDADAGIVHLRYTPKRKTARTVALVGKGICFDTGGTNLKPAKFMLGMHEDMEGSAVALGTLIALTELNADFAVDCWLALAQNHIGPKAYKPNDVVTASNGTTIEVIHTDAEGRMVLADTLAIASQAKPDLIVDYATLTGSCMHALGTAYSGAFTNRSAWVQTLIEAGRDSGERVWPFPTDDDYDKELESTVADVKQCAVEGQADHILAARFLGRFVGKDIPWIHIDLSAGNHKGGLAHIPTDTTAFGVRFTLSLLLDKRVQGSSE